MKTIITLISIFFITLTFSQNKKTTKAFGQIQGDKYVIVGDTVKLKSKMSHLIFGDSKEKTSFSVEIGKSKTFGEAIEDYYFVLLHDKKKNVTIAKWLERVDDKLFLVSDFTNENYWQVLTTACIGKEDCSPQVVIIDSEKKWICGHKLVCATGNNCKKVSAIETE